MATKDMWLLAFQQVGYKVTTLETKGRWQAYGANAHYPLTVVDCYSEQEALERLAGLVGAEVVNG